MEQVSLQVSPRTEVGSRPARRLRREGLVPAVVYGRDVDPIAISVTARDLTAALHTEAGLNALITVDLGDGNSVLTVAREIQRHPTRNEITHLDFIKVNLDEPIEAEVGVEYKGVPIGVHDEGGFVETIANTVLVLALPTAIPSHISLDISQLEVGDTLRVEDLPSIDQVTYLDDPDRPLVTVVVARAEEEEEEAEGEAELELMEAEEGEAATGQVEPEDEG